MVNKTVKKRLVLKKNIQILLTKILLVIIISLIGLICIKNNPEVKKAFIRNIYEKNFEFSKTRKIYDKYFGSILPLNEIVITEKPVFSEKLTYNETNTYKDGVALTVEDNYLVPALESGVVIFIGEKADYGTTMIVEQTNGIATFYANIEFVDIKLYDYIEKGELLGEALNNKVYLVFTKEGNYLDYKNYI